MNATPPPEPIPAAVPHTKAPKKGCGQKPTRREKARRLEEVLNLRLTGAEVWDIREYFASHRPADKGLRVLLGETTVYNYIAQVDGLLEQHLEGRRSRIINRHVAMRHRLYAAAVAKGDERCALAILDSLAKLLGLYPKPVSAIADAELDAEIARLAESGQPLLPAEAHEAAPAPAPGSPPASPPPRG